MQRDNLEVLDHDELLTYVVAELRDYLVNFYTHVNGRRRNICFYERNETRMGVTKRE